MNSVPNPPQRRPFSGPPTGAILLTIVCLAALFLTGCCPFCARLRNAEGVAYYRRGHHQAAVSAFQRAVAANPSNPDSYYNLAAAHHRMGRASGRQEDLVRAEQLYNQCLDRDALGTHRECYRGLAVLLVEEGRGDAAERLLQGWAAQRPALAAPHVELARLYRETGDVVAERDSLLQAVALDPNDARAHAALGRLHDEAGEVASALANYERALSGNSPMQQQLAFRVAALRATTPNVAAPSMPADAAARTASRSNRRIRMN